MLCPDKAHLFGFGLPLPPLSSSRSLTLSLHTGAASFSALGLFQQRWVSVSQIPHCQRKRGGTHAARHFVGAGLMVMKGFFSPLLTLFFGPTIPPSLEEGSSSVTRKIAQKHTGHRIFILIVCRYCKLCYFKCSCLHTQNKAM